MADNLTLRLKEELEKRHGKAVSEADVSSFLQSQGLLSGGAAAPQPPQQPQIPSSQGVPPWEVAEEEIKEVKGGALNALGVGLWSALDTATFGVPGAFVEEEKFLDFEDPLSKYTGAIGGLIGFVKGAPIRAGAKLLQYAAAPIIKAAGYKTVNQVSKQMLKRGAELGVNKTAAKEITHHYSNIARRAQTDADFAKTFGEKATKLLVNYTDDAVATGRISTAESAAIRKMFGENYMNRPMQDFLGLMSTRIANPRLARVAGSLLNESIMFGMIDTIFEGVSTMEDHHFDWTAPLWGMFTGVAFSQLQWLNPVGKGAKWGLDFRAGVKGAFNKKPQYNTWNNEQLIGTSKFFGESLERFGTPGGGSSIVSISHGGKKKSIDLLSDDVLKQTALKFGGETQGREALVKFFESQRKFFGKEIMKASTMEGLANIQKNWFRMAAGGVAFNAHTLAEMALHGTTPGFHDMLPHFLIGAFLQIGKNPASFDLDSHSMNQFRSNLKMLGVDVKQLNYVPSLKHTPNRFGNGVNRSTHPETLKLFEELGMGGDVIEGTEGRLKEGDISIKVQGNSKFDKIRDRLLGHFRFEKNPNNISTKDAQRLVEAFEAETGVKKLEDYDRHFDELAVQTTKELERDIPSIVRKIMLSDRGQELKMQEKDPKGDGKKVIQGPEVIMPSEEIIQMAKEGKLDFIKDAEGNVITDGTLALEKLMTTFDGYASIFKTSELLNKVTRAPAGESTKTVKTLETVKDIYENITMAEQHINSSFPSKMSGGEGFTFKKSAGDYIELLGQNMSIKNSRMIQDIFSTKSPNRDRLIDLMRKSGLLEGDLVNPLLRKNIEDIKIDFDASMPEPQKIEREAELKRALKKVLMLQSVTGGYERSEGVDTKHVKAENVEKLFGFLEGSGLKDVHKMKEWVHQLTINHIIRDKIGKSNLEMNEMNAFFEISEAGMADFNLDMKAGRQGFEIKLIDEAFVPEAVIDVAVEYNDFARKIIAKSGGLIQSSGKSIVQNEYDIHALNLMLPRRKEELNRASAEKYLGDFIDILPKGSQVQHDVAQYVLEGNSPDVINWLTRNGILEYNKKSSKGYNINEKKFNRELEVKLQNKIKKNGITDSYIKNVIASEEQAARAAHQDERFMVATDAKFDMNTFLQKYNIDGIDYSTKSKERKKEVFDGLFLSEVADAADRIPAARIVDNVLNRIEIKNTTTDKYVKFSEIDAAQKPSVKNEVVGDLIKLIASQYNSRQVNSFKFENGQIKEKTMFQQDTRLNTLLRELELPYVIIEKESVDYEVYGGRVQRVFRDLFGSTDDLPDWQRGPIERGKEKLVSTLNNRESSHGLTHEGGMLIFQVSKDTAPIAIARQNLPKMHNKYIEFADWALKQKNLDIKVKDQIRKITEKINDPNRVIDNKEIGNPTDFDYQYMLSQIVFNDMLKGEKKTSYLEEFFNGFDVSKTMGRIKLYDSKNFVKHDRNLLRSMMTVFRESLNDNKTFDAIGKIMQQDGFNVAIWNDKAYSNVNTEVRSILKENGWNQQKIDNYFNNVIGNAHESSSSFDSIAFVPLRMMRYGHGMMGNNPNSTNPIKPAIASGGRSGQLLLGKTLLVYDKSLDTFFQNNSSVDILLASTGAKAFNKGLLRDGLDSSVINKPFNRINSTKSLGAQKIRRIPIDALGFKPEVDKTFKDAVESTSDYNYMTNAESKDMFNQNYREDVKAAVAAMETVTKDQIRINRFVLDMFGEDSFSSNPESGGSQHLSNIAMFASMSRDANPMSYSENIVKNKIYSHFMNRILNGKRTTFKTEQGTDSRYGGQAPVIQVADARFRLKPTIVTEEGKMEMRGEIMIGEHERASSVSEIIKSGRQMIFVDGAKTIDPREFFGSYETKREGKKFIWDDMVDANFTLGQLYDVLEVGKTGVNPYSKNLQIGLVVNRKPHTRPNDTAILGLKGFLEKAYGKSALVNSLDIVNLFEGDYDADKVDYFYGARKAVHEHSKRVSDFYVQAIDPNYLKVETDFSWGDSPYDVSMGLQKMAASSSLAKKTIGVVQKIPRKLGYLNNIAMDGNKDPALVKRYGKDKKPKILFFTPGPDGERYRITVDFDNLDYFSRAALETQYMLDMGGGVNTELMRDVSEWSNKFLFPTAEEGISPRRVKKLGIGFINNNIIRKQPSKRIRIFRKFDQNGKEEILTQLEMDMIKTMMSEYGKFLNTAGKKTFNQKTGEQRSISYDDVFESSDSFFNFNRDLSKSLYYKLRYKKDRADNPYWKDNQFKSMFNPKTFTFTKYKDGKPQEKRYFKPDKNIFDGQGEQIKQNSLAFYEGERGGVLERSLHTMWKKDVFENIKDKGLEASPSITGDMVQYMDRWYDQLRTGEISEYSGSVDALQSNIMKTVTDYNSAAYYIGNLKQKVVTTQYRTDLPYKAKMSIIDKLNKVQKEVEKRIIELAPDKYFETYKSKDLKKFTFVPIKGKEAKEAQIQFNTIDTLLRMQKEGGYFLSPAGHELLQYLKDIRRKFYSNQENLGDIRNYKEKTVLGREQLDFLANMPDMTTFREVEDAILHKGLKEYGTPFIYEFMATAHNPFQIGIQDGRLVTTPFGKSGRFKRGYQFLTSVINAPKSNDTFDIMAGYKSTELNSAESVLRTLQIIEANFRRFQDRRFDMMNFSDSNYNVNIGTKEQPINLSLTHLRLPSFGKKLENVVGDYSSIRWARDTNRISSGFDIMNDSVLSYYRDIMEVAGKGPEFEKYLVSMHGLKQDMIKNKTIDPIIYLATKSQIQSDIKHIVNKVLTGGIDASKNPVAYKRLLQNPMLIINGGDGASGFFRGISLEAKTSVSAEKLREIVKLHNELSEGESVTRFRTEKTEKDLDRWLENC